MKITAIHSYHLRADLREPFAYSQWEYKQRATSLVEMVTDEGLIGWGESFGPAAPAACAVQEYFAPLLIGRDPRDTEALWHFLYARSIDYGQKGVLLAAISALDIACWDIKAQSAGVPLYRVLGGEETRSVR